MADLLTAPLTATADDRSGFQRYYEEAGPDYATWSPHFNMHFGFFRWGMNPFQREAMLEQMNQEILHRLDLERESSGRVPAGIPGADLRGIALVPWQLEQGRQLNQTCPQAGSITLALGDYEHTTFPSASFDAVYAIESSCYGHGANKSAFLREAHRLLRSGGRMVVGDGFLGPGKLCGPQKSIYRKLCECWATDTLGEVAGFTREMERIGFRDIVVAQVQSRVTPSVLHVPWVTLRFLLTNVAFGRRKMTRARWNNVLAPILLPLVGFPLGPVAYYIVSATLV
jgi:SAM-dependent methyltransferase